MIFGMQFWTSNVECKPITRMNIFELRIDRQQIYVMHHNVVKFLQCLRLNMYKSNIDQGSSVESEIVILKKTETG